MPSLQKTVAIDAFKGLNNTDKPQRTDPSFLKTALNVDIDSTGGIGKRDGFVSRIPGNWHSIWSDGELCYGVKDFELVRVYDTWMVSPSGVTTSAKKVSFDTDGRFVYFSSPDVNGVIDPDGTIRPWGLERPNPLPSISLQAGLLPAGEYQVALTYVDAFGRESGARSAQTISVSGGRGIVLSGMPIPVDSAIVGINVYATAQSGSQLVLVRSVPVGTGSVVINDVFGLVALKTIGVHPAPKGHLVRYAHSRMWIAENDIVWFSEPFTYDWFRYAKSFFHFEGRVRAIMPVSGGVWVAANKIHYLSGRDPEQMNRSEKEDALAVEGTETRISGGYLFIENTPAGIKWLIATNLGIYALFDNGLSINLTSRNVEFPLADKGTGMFVMKDGINRYMSILQKKMNTSSAVIGDQVTGTIIRNGVKVVE